MSFLIHRCTRVLERNSRWDREREKEREREMVLQELAHLDIV